MLFELPYRRMLILTEGHLGVFTSKTGNSVLRYRRGDCVGVLDSTRAGEDIGRHLPGISGVPIFASVEDAMSTAPDSILIGIAPSGGALPPAMRAHVVDALQKGMAIISGLHAILREDPELVTIAEQHNARIHDLRDAGPITRIARGRARQTRARRVLTVGTDCNIGKMVTALELRRAAVEAGLDAAFVATGQTGIMIEGWGIAIDHVISDFTAGAAEMLVERVTDRQICFIEGQGSIGHPGYSGVTLSLIHGTCPEVMVINHRPDRILHNGWQDCPVAPIAEQIALYERVASLMHPCRVVAVALNSAGMTDEAASEAVRSIGEATGLAVADPVRHGPVTLLSAVRQHLGI